MKKLTPTIIIVVLILSGFGAVAFSSNSKQNLITETHFFSKPIIHETNTFCTVELAEATSYLLGSENPHLPLITHTYYLPLGSTIDSVDVVFSEPITIHLAQKIRPGITPQILAQQKIRQTDAIYVNDTIYPSKSFTYRIGAGLHKGNRVNILSIQYSPVMYIPSKNLLLFSASADTLVRFTPPAHPIVFSDAYDMLILAPSEFASSLHKLVDHKNTHGIATKLVTLEDIPATGYDVQESIKYYIKDAVETWGVTYVLLVGGGVKGSEKFPVRNTWVSTPGYEEYFPSDLYYADIYDSSLGFSTWDANSNHKYGEFPFDNVAVDIYPDVYLGRLACNDVSEVKSVVNKIIDYTTKNKMTNRIIQMGGDTFPEDPENINEGEYCNEKVMEKLPGYTPIRLWGSNGQLTRMNCIFAFYQSADFVDFSGHGSFASWATHPPGDASVWIPQGGRFSGFLYIDAAWMYNFYKLPVVVFNACSCSKFSESENCLGWSLIQKRMGGAIASYGASGIGYGSYGSSEDDRFFGWMEVHLFEGLHTDRILGQVWGDGITAYTTAFIAHGGDVFDADYKTVEELTLLGDPSLVIQ